MAVTQYPKLQTTYYPTLQRRVQFVPEMEYRIQRRVLEPSSDPRIPRASCVAIERAVLLAKVCTTPSRLPPRGPVEPNSTSFRLSIRPPPCAWPGAPPAVGVGAAFPDDEDLAHQANEYIDLENLHRNIKIFINMETLFN